MGRYHKQDPLKPKSLKEKSSLLTREQPILSPITDPIAATLRRLKSQPRNLLAIGILITIVTFGLTSNHFPLSSTANADSQRIVSLYVDGTKRIFSTDATTVGDVLAHSGVKLQTGDLVEPVVSTTVPTGFFNVNVYRARPVLVVDGDKSYRVMSAYQSPHLLAEAAGLKLYPEDDYATEAITDIVDNNAIGMKVTVKRAMPFTIHADNKDYSLRSQPDTLGEALKNEHFALGAKDTVSLPLTAPVHAGMSATVTRVTDANVVVTDVIPRPVQNVTDPTLLKGQTQVKDDGADGQKTALYSVHYNNGVETSRVLINLVSQTAARAKITIIGTKVIYPSDAINLGEQMAAAHGWTGDQWDALYTLWMHESGWNPNARNGSSGACGIPQANPCSKIGDMSAAGQITWGLGYITTRYGDPVHAWAYWKAHGSY